MNRAEILRLAAAAAVPAALTWAAVIAGHQTPAAPAAPPAAVVVTATPQPDPGVTGTLAERIAAATAWLEADPTTEQAEAQLYLVDQAQR